MIQSINIQKHSWSGFWIKYVWSSKDLQQKRIKT